MACSLGYVICISEWVIPEYTALSSGYLRRSMIASTTVCAISPPSVRAAPGALPDPATAILRSERGHAVRTYRCCTLPAILLSSASHLLLRRGRAGGAAIGRAERKSPAGARALAAQQLLAAPLVEVMLRLEQLHPLLRTPAQIFRTFRV